MEKDSKAGWLAITANIIGEHKIGPEQETVKGTRLFRAGSKVHIIDRTSAGTFVVIGRHRHKKHYIKCFVRSDYVENFRLGKIYSSTITDIAERYFTEVYGKDHGLRDEEQIKFIYSLLVGAKK